MNAAFKVLIGLLLSINVVNCDIQLFNSRLGDDYNLTVWTKNDQLIVISNEKEYSFSIISSLNSVSLNSSEYISIHFKVEHDELATALFSQRNVTTKQITNQAIFNFSVKGKFVGITHLLYEAYLITPNYTINLTQADNVVCPVKIRRKMEPVYTIFPVCIGIMVALNNINMGCFLNFDLIKKVLQRPVAPIIGLASQFLVMPLGSYIYGYLYFSGIPSWRLGLFILGCSPGGSLSNFYTLLFDGDVDLSITMTFFSTIAATFMMPLWIYTLGSTLITEADLKIPYANILLSIVGLTIPLSFGIYIRERHPNWVSVCKKIIKPFTIVVILVAVTGGVLSNLYIFKLINFKVILAGMSVAWSGYFFGAIFATLVGLKTEQIVTVSIETALQNPAIAFMVLFASLPEPEADLAIVPVVGQLLMTGPPTWTALCFYFLIRWCLKRNEKKKLKANEITYTGKTDTDKKPVIV